MPLLSNPRHEAFAQARANGVGVYDAYIAAGFEGNPTAATQVGNRPEVIARITEIQSEKVEKRRQQDAASGEDESINAIDREWIVKELRGNVRKAQETGQITAANKAIELIMEVLDIGPKKRTTTDEEETAKKEHKPPNDDKLVQALDKIAQMAESGEAQTP